MNQQTKNEIRIFKKFAKLCPYPIHLDSITKKEHPEPDISCVLSDGNIIAFELVECIDKSTAQSIYGSQKLKKAFHSELEKLPKEKKERFKRIFRDALISVTFIKKVSANKKRFSIPLILEYLLTVRDTPYGKFNLRSHKGLKDVVDCISISRVDSGRPTFDVKDPNFFNDPCRERIQDKFVKEYEIKFRADLLAYYELQYEFHESYWLPSVQSFVEGNIESSVFQRVWIYSVTNNEIIFVYPVL
jgi:hypothetical protein